MELLDRIKKVIDDAKFNKLKFDYVKEYEKNRVFGDMSEIQDFIAKKGITIVPCVKYGDKYDEIEDVFIDNEPIKKSIKMLRLQDITGKIENMEYLFDESEEKGEPIYNLDRFKELKERLYSFANRYLDEPNDKNIDIKDDFAQNMDDFVKMTDIARKIMPQETSLETFLSEMIHITKICALSKLKDSDSLAEKQDVSFKAQETLDEMYNNFLTDKRKNEIFIDFLKNLNDESTIEFIERVETIRQLSEMGIYVKLNDDSISYINTNDDEMVKQIYNEVEKKKEELAPKKVTAKDFAMVRTTEYFPKNHEMEIVDELNSRIYISNFLSGKFANEETEKEFGKNWLDKAYTMPDNLERARILSIRERILEKYESLSTMCKSTKHFTLNGLMPSREYEDFSINPYIIIEPLEEHINDENLLGINEADTYFKVSRDKPLILSDRAEIVMAVEEYLKLKDNPELLEEIRKYKMLTLFSGDEKTAVDMVLAKNGYLPERIGKWGYELESKMDLAISTLSKKYEKEIAVHNHSDIKKDDDEKTLKMQTATRKQFVDEFFEKFSIDEKYREKAMNENLSDEELEEIISKCGVFNIRHFITEFNEERRRALDKKRDEFYEKKAKKEGKK